MNIIIEGTQLDGRAVVVARIGNLAAPERVVDCDEAAGPDQLKEFFVISARADLEILQIAGAGTGSAAQDGDATLLVAQAGVEGVAAEIGIDGRGIRAVTLEHLDGVVLGRGQ